MGSRILQLKPPCAYNLEGIESAFILDFEDFGGYRFVDDKTYDTGLVSAIIRTRDFVELPAPEGAKYSSSVSGRIHTHTLETFIPDLTADITSQLNLGLRRRYVVLFRLRNGRYFTFGLDSGATLTHANQTEGAVGAAVNLTARSIYPLFEAKETALSIPSTNWILLDGEYGYLNEYWFDSGKWNYNKQKI